jgi:hydrogenase maturation factor
MLSKNSLPVGKLPPEILKSILARAPLEDPQVMLGPGIGLDCAVIDLGERLLVIKSDPITFASDKIGWYAVQVNANDIATTGATARWFLVTLLLPEGTTDIDLVDNIMDQVYDACTALDITVIGGHTEITYNLDRPILVGTMIGEVAPERLITPRGAQPGDRLLLTKFVPIEATAILAREFSDRMLPHLTQEELQQAQDYLEHPGISVVRDAQIAISAGRVHAMHDPTEGGLSAALWELAEASQTSLCITPYAVPVSALWERVNQAFAPQRLDPLAAIASGALLAAVHPDDAGSICAALEKEHIPCADIGEVEEPRPDPAAREREICVWQQIDKKRKQLPRPERDEIARLFEKNSIRN